jgi:peptidoglycan/LPS O-acetylase OafA/YrhL
MDSFFVLSGFLITSLRVREWSGTGTIRLRRFWAGRARRLLPALLLLIAVMGFVMAVVPTVLATSHVPGDPVSTMFSVSNWYSIHAAGVTYFSLSTQPSPLLHTGRGRSRSSSLWCGRSSCWACSRSARPAGPRRTGTPW